MGAVHGVAAGVAVVPLLREQAAEVVRVAHLCARDLVFRSGLQAPGLVEAGQLKAGLLTAVQPSKQRKVLQNQGSGRTFGAPVERGGGAHLFYSQQREVQTVVSTALLVVVAHALVHREHAVAGHPPKNRFHGVIGDALDLETRLHAGQLRQRHGA